MKNVFKILAVTILAFSIYAFTSHDKKETIKVIIDAGHGGFDSGAKHDAFLEKDIVSQISTKIKALNKNTNIELYYTRTDDNSITLEERTKIINDIKPDLFLSLHVNSSKNTAASGSLIYVAKDSPFKEKSLFFANALTFKLAKSTNLKVNETQDAPFYILKHAECPGLLIDLGYISNDNDRNYILDEKNQQLISNTILEFISEIKK